MSHIRLKFSVTQEQSKNHIWNGILGVDNYSVVHSNLKFQGQNSCVNLTKNVHMCTFIVTNCSNTEKR
jgi:hypothetical protein